MVVHERSLMNKLHRDNVQKKEKELSRDRFFVDIGLLNKFNFPSFYIFSTVWLFKEHCNLIIYFRNITPHLFKHGCTFSYEKVLEILDLLLIFVKIEKISKNNAKNT